MKKIFKYIIIVVVVVAITWIVNAALADPMTDNPNNLIMDGEGKIVTKDEYIEQQSEVIKILTAKIEEGKTAYDKCVSVITPLTEKVNEYKAANNEFAANEKILMKRCNLTQ